FAASVSADAMREWDDVFASRITRDLLDGALAGVPDTFLAPMIARDDTVNLDDALRRRRAAYVAFLWKRLKAPRTFADPGIAPDHRAVRTGPPNWLGRRW